MLKINQRRMWLVLTLLLLLATTVMAQGPRTLVSGTPVTGTLNSNNLLQVFTLDGKAGEIVTITATNDGVVPLAMVLTDSAGTIIAQSYDLDITGQVSINDVTLPASDTYNVTLFKSAGVDSFTDATFTLTATVTGETTPTAAATLEPIAEATEEGTPEVTPEATPVPSGGEVSQLLTTSGLQVVLSWNTTDDLDLEVRDPVGGSLYWETPTVSSGGSLSPNANQGCTATTSSPSETASWTPGGIPTGSYEVLVYFQAACAGTEPVPFSVAITVDGNALDPVEGTVLEGQVFVTSFVVNADGSSELTGLSGIVSNALPAEAAALISEATENPITIGSSVNGTITNAQPYQVFSFDGQAGTLVTIDMTSTSGSLDTFLFLLDSRGNVIDSNDDAGDGVTDSQIASGLLTETGTYTIVATRYAKRIGGTEGTFALTLSSTQVQLPEGFADLPRGPLEIRLLWQTNADLQLLVRDPAGESVFDDVPEIRSGGRLAAQGNVNCTAGTPFSYIYWPTERPPRPGVYEVEVWFQSECGDTSPVTFNLDVAFNGQEVMSSQARPQFNERYLTSFTITADGQVIPSDGGIITGADSLNFMADLENAATISAGEPRTGSITQDNKFDLFVFNGQAGNVVNIAMNNTSGSLDPSLYLIGPDGTQVAANDDAVPGENTNSLISNFTLPVSGQYIIIATHFGAQYGGTTGTYSLTLTIVS